MTVISVDSRSTNLVVPPPSVLAISGSERPEGNTEQVLGYVGDLVRGRGATFSVVNLREYEIAPCGVCGDCNDRDRPCTAQDDLRPIIDQMIGADVIIYAVPVHAFGMAAPMQKFIERAGVGHLRFARPLVNKVGGIIVIGRRYSHSQVFSQLVLNMLLNRMVLVGSGFPALLSAGEPGEAWKDREGLDSVRRMVARSLDSAIALKRMLALDPTLLPVDPENERALAAALPPPTEVMHDDLLPKGAHK